MVGIEMLDWSHLDEKEDVLTKRDGLYKLLVYYYKRGFYEFQIEDYHNHFFAKYRINVYEMDDHLNKLREFHDVKKKKLDEDKAKYG